MPYSINHGSKLLLDVVLSTSVQPVLANSAKFDPVAGQTNVAAGAPINDRVIIAFGAAHLYRRRLTASKATLFQHIVTHASRKARESEVDRRFISLLAPEVQETVRTSSEIYQAYAKAIKDGHRELSRADLSQELSGNFQKLEDMMVKNSELQEAAYAKQEEIKQLQEQTYELHEYPIPRLFVDVKPFSNKFRLCLYFLCECGEHTKSISSKTELSHDIHFAKNEGYEIFRSSELFQQYGPYVLTILKMLKFGVSVAGVALRDNIEPGMDHVIDWMDKVSANEGEGADEFAKQMERKEALVGADLCKLNTFLMDKDGNKVLGNLYRTVTDEGHVKWVCIDHYRVNYQENSAIVFLRVLNSVGGTFSGKPHACKMSCGLASGRIGGKELGILVEALKTNSTLTTLNLEDNSIGPNGAQALSEALKTN
ncbi:hypothetical protein BGZ96_011313 [Linnemannia gamsii]|uniref:Uncharacterized protein n=1 Tax=Linnemannia gamsii TaxID=64522 RepID=A0ABQ7JU38_9FUNG|nr:hypothetical protein BGZ96_011313 [Linnemannia gamsii]